MRNVAGIKLHERKSDETVKMSGSQLAELEEKNKTAMQNSKKTLILSKQQ